MSKKKDYCNYDWFHILSKWNDMGRTGLTIHALASLCQRSPFQILRELQACVWTSWQYCGEVKATVFDVDDYPQEAGVPLSGDEDLYDLELPAYFQRCSSEITSCREQLKTYPWPIYQNIVRGVGEKTLSFYRNDEYLCGCESCYDCDGLCKADLPDPAHDTSLKQMQKFISENSHKWTSPKRKATH